MMKQIVINIPPEVEDCADDIRRFVDAMIYKLKVNAHKGRWETYGQEKAMQLLVKEAKELQQAMAQGGNLIEILMESADVANFAMIIASIATERGNEEVPNRRLGDSGEKDPFRPRTHTSSNCQE